MSLQNSINGFGINFLSESTCIKTLDGSKFNIGNIHKINGWASLSYYKNIDPQQLLGTEIKFYIPVFIKSVYESVEPYMLTMDFVAVPSKTKITFSADGSTEGCIIKPTEQMPIGNSHRFTGFGETMGEPV